MKIGDYPAEKPNLDHIIGGENPVLSIFLRGHLVLEALLNELIIVCRYKSEAALAKMNSAAKIDLVKEKNIISTGLHEFLKQVNWLRNNFAHRLGYDLSENDVHLLIKLAGKAPEIDFSDDMHTLDTPTLYEWYGDTCGVLEEMFKHAALDIGFLLEEHGGELPFTN